MRSLPHPSHASRKCRCGVLPSRGGTGGSGTGLPAGRAVRRRASGHRGWTRPSRPSSTTPAARCWSSPAPAPGRRRRSSRRSPRGSGPGIDPEQILVLTFSRKAAAELRTRITSRVGGDHPRAAGPHVPLLRLRRAPPGGGAARRGAAAAADVGRAGRGRRRAAPRRRRGGGSGPLAGGLTPALGTAGFRTELRELLLRATERGVSAAQLAAWGRESGRDALGARRRLPGAVRGGHGVLHRRPWRRLGVRPGRAGPAGHRRAGGRRRTAAPGARAGRLAVRRRVPGHRPGPGGAARTAGRRWRQPGRGRRSRPGDLRLPRRRAARHRRVPRAVPAHRQPSGRPGARSGSAAGPAPSCCASAARVAEGCPGRGSTVGSPRSRAPTPGGPRCTCSARRRWRPPTWPTSCAVRTS